MVSKLPSFRFPFTIAIFRLVAFAFSHKKNLYPRYCSTYKEMLNRFIPPLTNDTTYLKIQLLQVSIIMRHGSRTPHTLEDCWDGYSARWDCADTMTTLMKPASDTSGNKAKQGFLFEKKYDIGRNVLNGSCLKGQLIDEGHEQQAVNGQILRSAYITTNNFNQRLFESTQYVPNSVRFRADDKQRTLVSGQILIRSLFDLPANIDIVMPLITADYHQDVLTMKEETCPVLKELSKEAYSSEDYLQIINSNNIKDLLNVFSNQTLRWKNPERDLIDCLMTTYCNDRQDSMPDSLWERGNSSAKEEGVTDDDGSLFSRLYNFYEWKKSFHLTYNNAQYAKISISPLLAEITDIMKLTATCKSLKEVTEMNLARLHLISAHDTTLSSMMASWSIWDGRLAPYASMLIFESYHVVEKDTGSNITHAIRLLYNGQIITSKFPGCPDYSELCDLNIFLDYIQPFSMRDRNCNGKEDIRPLTASPSFTFQSAIFIILGFYIIGSTATYFAMSRMHRKIGVQSISGYRLAQRNSD